MAGNRLGLDPNEEDVGSDLIMDTLEGENPYSVNTSVLVQFMRVGSF